MAKEAKPDARARRANSLDDVDHRLNMALPPCSIPAFERRG
jgi:hypothetical protein